MVFDIIQQIFHGRLDRTLDRELALSVFLDARLIDRILAGQAANDSKYVRARPASHNALLTFFVLNLVHVHVHCEWAIWVT